MPLTKLQFRPGIVQDLTSYSNEGGWRDGDKVRFRLGYPEKIGGWAKYDQTRIDRIAKLDVAIIQLFRKHNIEGHTVCEQF